MRKRESFFIVLSVIALLCMGGCSVQIPNATEEQMDAIGEYATILLQKYNTNQRSRLVDDETIMEYDKKMEQLKTWEESPTEETEAMNENPNEEYIIQEKPYGTFEDFFALPDGVEMEYTGYNVWESFPENISADECFMINATEGKKLLVLEFQLYNHSAERQTIDFSKSSSIKITVNGSFTKGVFSNIPIENDLTTYSETIESGECVDLVLLTEMDEEVLKQVDTLYLDLKNELNKSTIQLK